MNVLKVGVIGVGHLGTNHARVYHELPGVRLVGVMDVDEQRAAAVAQRYGVSAWADLSACLSMVDAVSVAVPTTVHYPVVRECLMAGVHVLVEKPIASTVEEAQAMVDLARRRNRVLQVGHIERFNPVLDEIRPFIHHPAFIECHRLSPFQPRGTDVDVVLDLMIHDLDIVRSFDLGAVKHVQASGITVLSSTIDFANARLEFESGCVANMTASRISTGRLRKLRLFQPELYLSIDYHARSGRMSRRVVSSEGALSSVETIPIQADTEEPLKRELRAFVRSVEDGAPVVVPGEEGVAALQLAQDILALIRTSKVFSKRQAAPHSIPSAHMRI
ncbi:MAG: gfo/Idh/MocA family oxidoreductase [Nitrospirae bacterium]|nr:MAG: gfo/Idh/MocA family oxidoreductase [Nitrospirota bacterium]